MKPEKYKQTPSFYNAAVTLFFPPLDRHNKPSGWQTTTRRQYFPSLRFRILLDGNVLPGVIDCANTECYIWISEPQTSPAVM